MVRAPDPGGRLRLITILQNQNLIVGGAPVDGLRVDEVGEFYDDGAFHANFWIVEPLLTRLKNAFDGTPSGDDDQDNDLFQKMRNAGVLTAKQVIGSLKRPGGYVVNNVMFCLASTIATPRRVWA